MKLIIASLSAAIVLASSASAMVLPTQIDTRNGARSALSQVQERVVKVVPTDSYAIDGRSKIIAGSKTLKVTTFKTRNRPADSTDLR